MMSFVALDTRRKYGGFTLFELLLVVAIIGTFAVAAVQSSTPVQKTGLDTVVQQTLHALRFARQEARRTSSNATVSFDAASGTLRVYQLDFSGGSPVEKILTHPLTKAEYRLRLAPSGLNGTEVGIDSLFNFSDGTSASAVGFDEVGAPGKVVGQTQVTPLAITGTWRGLWQPAVGYLAGDWVVFNNENYDCVSNHNSSSDFSLDASRWVKRTARAHIHFSANGHREVLHVAPVTGFTRVGAW